MDDDRQLNLFSWDRVKAGEGFNALARLDPATAVCIFEDVLSRWPGHPDASAGLRMAVAWDASLEEVEALQVISPRMRVWGDSCWRLVAPWEVEWEQIDDMDLSDAVADEDVRFAAIYGWLGRILPLVEVEVESPRDEGHEEALLVYHTVRRAERARANGTHDEMVEQRRLSLIPR